MPLDLSAIRARWSKATPGPWEWDTEPDEWKRYRLWRPNGCGEVIIPTYDGEGSQSMLVSHDDAACLAAAPTDIAALLSEFDRLTSELAAAQAERVPVVEWADTLDGYKAEKGDFTFTVGPDGWWLSILDRRGVDAWIEGGNETGPAGKSAAEAAYRRACGLSAP